MKLYEKALKIQNKNDNFEKAYLSLVITITCVIIFGFLSIMINNGDGVIYEKQLNSYYELVDKYYFDDDSTTYKTTKNPDVYFLSVMLMVMLPIGCVIMIISLIKHIHKKANKKYFKYTKEFIKKYLEFKDDGKKNKLIEELNKFLQPEQSKKVFTLVDTKFIDEKDKFEKYSEFENEYDVKI